MPICCAVIAMVIHENLIFKLSPSSGRTLLNVTRGSVLTDPRQKHLLNEVVLVQTSDFFLVHTTGPRCLSVTLVLHGIKITSLSFKYKI